MKSGWRRKGTVDDGDGFGAVKANVGDGGYYPLSLELTYEVG
jgi:hypothetical protein